LKKIAHIQIFRSEATLPLPGGGWGVGQTKGACLPPASDGTKKAGQYDLLFMYPEPCQTAEIHHMCNHLATRAISV